MGPVPRKFFTAGLILLGIFLGVRYLLPLAVPFLLGTALALAAEPAVNALRQRGLPRRLASGLGVCAAFLLLAALLLSVGALLVRLLRTLTALLPELERTALSAMALLRQWLEDLCGQIPGSLGTLVLETTGDLFSGSAAVLERLPDWLLSLTRGIVSKISGGTFALFTTVISSFMISARLPRLRKFCAERFPREKLQALLDLAKRLRLAVTGYLKAQVRLCGTTFLICAPGLLLLRTGKPVLRAALIALVDALPVLGAGAALIPWSLLSFVQGDRLVAFGLLGLYALCAVVRSVLEPRLIGRQLGLDPLVTLMTLYAGYRLWGLPGMLLSPLLAVILTRLFSSGGSARTP